MKKAKKIINGLAALAMGQLPLLFPAEGIMMAVFILGLLSIVIITYSILELINN